MSLSLLSKSIWMAWSSMTCLSPECSFGTLHIRIIPKTNMLITNSRFKLSLPPIEGEAAEGDAESLIRTKALDRGVLALPGTVFYANGRKTAFVRAAFSVLNDADTDEAVRRLGDVLREVHAEAMVKSA